MASMRQKFVWGSGSPDRIQVRIKIGMSINTADSTLSHWITTFSKVWADLEKLCFCASWDVGQLKARDKCSLDVNP